MKNFLLLQVNPDVYNWRIKTFFLSRLCTVLSLSL
jgi:hypothetical protein